MAEAAIVTARTLANVLCAGKCLRRLANDLLHELRQILGISLKGARRIGHRGAVIGKIGEPIEHAHLRGIYGNALGQHMSGSDQCVQIHPRLHALAERTLRGESLQSFPVYDHRLAAGIERKIVVAGIQAIVAQGHDDGQFGDAQARGERIAVERPGRLPPSAQLRIVAARDDGFHVQPQMLACQPLMKDAPAQQVLLIDTGIIPLRHGPGLLLNVFEPKASWAAQIGVQAMLAEKMAASQDLAHRTLPIRPAS